MTEHPWKLLLAAGVLVPLVSAAARAEDPEGEPPESLESQIRGMEVRHKAEMEALKVRLGALQPPDTQQMIDELAEEVDELREEIKQVRPGTTNFIVTGYAFTNYFDLKDENSSFGAGFNPIFLWKLSDQLFIKAELEVELEDDETEVALEYLDLSFVVNDYLTLSAGKFLTPLSYFKENLHPAWINRLPAQPMFASGSNRLIPTSSLGLQARGGVPVGDMKLTYAGYVANGFAVKTMGASAGKLGFANFDDINDNKSIGARFGFFPIPEFEGYYGFSYGDVAPSGSSLGDIDALVHVAGLNFVIDERQIGGQLRARFEYVFSDVSDVDYGSGVFNNERKGGYAELAYRPTTAGSFFENLEGVFRYDFVDQPSGAPDPADIDRYTVGINYWLSSSAVFKFAYQFDDVDDPTGATTAADGVLFQFAIGF